MTMQHVKRLRLAVAVGRPINLGILHAVFGEEV